MDVRKCLMLRRRCEVPYILIRDVHICLPTTTDPPHGSSQPLSKSSMMPGMPHLNPDVGHKCEENNVYLLGDISGEQESGRSKGGRQVWPYCYLGSRPRPNSILPRPTIILSSHSGTEVE
jgi:hypothetical protein